MPWYISFFLPRLLLKARARDTHTHIDIHMYATRKGRLENIAGVIKRKLQSLVSFLIWRKISASRARERR